jgi:hypothetical protein
LIQSVTEPSSNAPLEDATRTRSGRDGSLVLGAPIRIRIRW